MNKLQRKLLENKPISNAKHNFEKSSATIIFREIAIGQKQKFNFYEKTYFDAK